MTATATIQIKMIAALIEAIDGDDVKDCEKAVAMIRTLIEAEKK